MNPLEFIFTLISQYVPITPGRLQALKGEAEAWYTNEETSKNSKVAAWVISKGNIWYVQLGLAVLFIGAVRWIHDFMNPKKEDGTGNV